MARATLPERRSKNTTLPVASAAQVRGQAKVLLAEHRRPLLGMLALNGFGALAALVKIFGLRHGGATAAPAAAATKQGPKRSSKPKTIEEQVAAGGPRLPQQARIYCSH